MSTLEIVELVVLGVVALALIVFYTIKAIKNNWIEEISNAIYKAIKEAEASGKSGEEKKKYVLEQVEKACQEKGIPFFAIYQLTSKFIDKVISNYNVLAKK